MERCALAVYVPEGYAMSASMNAAVERLVATVTGNVGIVEKMIAIPVGTEST